QGKKSESGDSLYKINPQKPAFYLSVNGSKKVGFLYFLIFSALGGRSI
ncbi:hypothetical protein MNBD_IGNAVI01-35, partial [hydrothermal vent metagenome]